MPSAPPPAALPGPAAYEALLGLCQARRSCRSFRPDPVPPAMIEQIVAVAQTAPYASRRRNWDIVPLVAQDTREAMAHAVKARVEQLADQIRDPDTRKEFVAYAANFAVFAEAPVVFALSFRSAPSLSLFVPDPNGTIAAWEHDSLVKSISCPAMLVLLAATSLGLASCYMTGPLLAGSALDALAGVRMGRNLAALIPVGYPKGDTL